MQSLIAMSIADALSLFNQLLATDEKACQCFIQNYSLVDHKYGNPTHQGSGE